MEPTPWVISHRLNLELIDPTGEASRLEGELEYSSADPFAVVAVFRSGPTPIRWVFARDLLAEGLFAPAGDGDVHVWPSLDNQCQAVVLFELISPHGEALLQATSRDVSRFLHETFTMVPSGAEDMNLDIDHTVLQLLAEGAHGVE